MPIDPNLVGKFLEQKIKKRQITNYGAVAAHFGLPKFDGAWGSHPLSVIFEVLDQQDAVSNRPFRTAVVVGESNNSPGSGLYEALERLKGIPDPVTPSAREKIWIDELNAAYNYLW